MWDDDKGGETAEWPLVITLLVVAVIASLLHFEGPMTDLYSSIASALFGIPN